jgi:hypothetical protein
MNNYEESRIQRAAIKALRLMWTAPEYSGLPEIFAINNGNNIHGNKKERMIKGKRQREEGVLKGVPDLLLPIPRGAYSGLFIETKTPKGRLSDSQKEVIPKLQGVGYAVFVCRSTQDIIDTVLRYLELP